MRVKIRHRVSVWIDMKLIAIAKVINSDDCVAECSLDGAKVRFQFGLVP
jgi:hypothetical protein